MTAIRSILISVLLSVMLLLFGLFVADKYMELRYKNQFIDEFNDKWFVKLRSMSPNLNTTFRPTVAFHKMDSFPLDLKDYACMTDSNGLIITPANHQTANLNIGFFGGSTTQCLYVEPQNRMPEATARQLEKLTGLKVNVWNAAAGGSHSQHTINVLNNLALHLPLDYAFFYGNINDLGTLMHYSTYINDNIEKGVFFNYNRYAKAHFDINKSQWYPHLRFAVRQLLLEQNQPYDEYKDVRGKPLILDTALIFPNIRQAFTTIIYTCRARNIQPVFINQLHHFESLDYAWLRKNMPSFQPTEAEYKQFLFLLKQYNELMREVAQTHQVTFIDLSDLPIEFNEFSDAIHFNDRGGQKVGRAIATKFLNTVELTPSPHE
jgi:lysophospholipase L1-like esterase